MKLKAFAVAAGLAFTLLAGAPKSEAAVTVLTGATSNTLHVGDTVQLSLQLNLTSDPFTFGAAFLAGVIQVFTGDGQSHTFAYGPGGTVKNFLWDTTYTTAGSFTPSFLGFVSYTERFIFAPRFPFPVIQGLSGDFQTAGLGDTVINVAAAAPEPATWMMMLLGFAALGFVAYRRAKAVAVAA